MRRGVMDGSDRLVQHREAIVAGLDPSKRTVQQLIEEDLAAYESAGRASESLAHRRWALEKVTATAGEGLVGDLTARDIEAVLGGLQKLSPRSRNAVRKACIGLLDRAVRDGLLTRNPARDVKAVAGRSRRPKLPLRKELVGLLDLLLGTSPYGPILNAIAAGALRTGEAREGYSA